MRQQLREGMILAQQDVGKALVVAIGNIVARLQPLDQVGFQQQGIGLAGGGDEQHLGRFGDHVADAFVMGAAQGIGADAFLQALGLADIQHIACRIHHAIDARRVGQGLEIGGDALGAAHWIFWGRRFGGSHAANILAGALNLYTDAFRAGQGMQLFHPHPHGAYPGVLETGCGDVFGQGFRQFDMAFGDDGADALLDHMVIDHVFQHVLGIGYIVGGKVNIDADRLHPPLLVAIDADMGQQFQVTDEDMAQPAGGTGDAGSFYLAHSFTPTSGVCQIRCWPPSTAIIWPVTASASRR